MIQINKLPEYHNELIINGKDYNGETPQDELQYHIESNISFVEDEEEALANLIASEPIQ